MGIFNFNKKPDFGIYSFYRSNISPAMVKGQEAVFKKMGYTIQQVMDDEMDHYQFLNNILSRSDTPEYILFFDIDCIPLHKEAIERVLQQLSDNKTIAGAAQTANHLLEGKNLYVGPFFMGISKKVYQALGCPDMGSNNSWDIGALPSILAKFREDISIKFWFPTHVEQPKWNLYQHGMFGLGTTYEGLVYHAFESRWGDSDSIFMKKCASVIAGK